MENDSTTTDAGGAELFAGKAQFAVIFGERFIRAMAA